MAEQDGSGRTQGVTETLRPISAHAETLALTLTSDAAQRKRAVVDLEADCPKPGDRIGEDGRFEILARLGAGGMGVVVRAMDSKLGREIAVKFLMHAGADAMTLGLIRQEAMATAKLNHENIVQIFDLGGWQGRPFLVMEYLEGDSLDDLASRERPSPRRAIEILTDVALGLDHAHRRGIVHRDLKPSNVFIRRDGRAKILDFGIALIDKVQSELNAKDLSIVGTPAYMAPERWADAPHDEKVDIWAAGVIFHELLTGKNPYQGEDLFSIYRKIALEAPPEIDAQRLGLPAEAARIVKRALAKDPGQRFQTAAELADALAGLAKVMDRAPARRRRAGAAGRRAITFLSCAFGDVEGTSDHADSDDVCDALLAYGHVFARQMERFEGTVLSSLGGKMLACFGYPAAHEDDAERAARAAMQILAEIEREGEGARPAVRVGIHTGTVIVEEIAIAGQPRVPMILGDAPTVANRLAESAEAGTVSMSTGTEQIVRGLFTTAPIDVDAPVSVPAPPVSMRPVEAHRLVAALSKSSRFERSFAQGLTQLVGRDREVELLFSLWDRAKRGAGQLALLSGEAGIGKSRLVQVLRDCVAEEGMPRLLCQSWSHLSHSPFYPLVEMLTRSARINRDDSADERLAKLEQLVGGRGLSLQESIPLLASLLGIPLPARYTPPALTPVLQKERTTLLFEELFLRLSNEQPALLVVEDVHWLDPSSLEVFARMVEKVARSNLLLVLTCRPEFRATWGERPHVHRLDLERMAERSAARLVGAMARGEALPDEIVARIVARTDGVPLFIEELTRVVLEGWQRGERSVEALLPEAVPVTLHDLLVARLDRLGDDAREVAEIGAALGKSFPYAVLAACARREEQDLQENILRLIEAGVFHPRGQKDDVRIEFRHAMIQETAYRSQIKAKRQPLHLRIAKVYEERFPEVVEAQPEIIAHHFMEAGNPGRAIAFWKAAGRRATMRAHNAEAIAHLTKALEAAKGLPEGRDRLLLELELNVSLGAPLVQTKGYTAVEVRTVYENASLLCKAVGDTPQFFPTAFGLWAYYLMAADLPTALDHGEQMTTLAGRAGDDGLLVVACRGMGSALFYEGSFARSEEHLARGIEVYQPEKHAASAGLYVVDSGVSCLSHLLLVEWLLGRADDARATATEAIARAKGSGHIFTQAFALCHVAVLGQFLRDPGYATHAADAALSLGQEHGFPQPVAWSSMVRAWAVAQRGSPHEALGVLRKVVEAWKRLGARLLLNYWYALLAEASLRAGLPQDAEVQVKEAIALEEATGQLWWAAELRRLRGEIQLLQGGSGVRRAGESQAHADFLRAIEIAKGQGARSLELRATLSLARLLERRGARDEAVARVERIRGEITQGADTADLEAAEAFLRGEPQGDGDG